MKKVILGTVLVSLVLVELYICVALFSTRWEHAINLMLFRALPTDQTTITHPALDLEIDQAVGRTPGLRFALDMLFGLCLALNTLLVVKIWKALRRGPRRNKVLSGKSSP